MDSSHVWYVEPKPIASAKAGLVLKDVKNKSMIFRSFYENFKQLGTACGAFVLWINRSYSWNEVTELCDLKSEIGSQTNSGIFKIVGTEKSHSVFVS